MDVQLYVYDLSRGMARQMSMAFLGVQIDAVYHTSLVFGNVEYFFGAGVQTCYPGTTHHGQPMEKVEMGTTQVPLEVVLEYLDSLKKIYTAESYDLFMHNCNNFSNDFAMFLVGKGIPKHITSLPQKVLDTPFGQMLKPQLDQAMRGVTQAPVNPANVPPTAASQAAARTLPPNATVRTTTSLSEVQTLLRDAPRQCAMIFFTASSCPPCKICYKPYEQLAQEFAGKITLIKVDLDFAQEVAAHYAIRATPTFITFLSGEKTETWSGADPARLRASVEMLVRMAHPAHPHSDLKVPTFRRAYRPDIFSASPPLDKLMLKLGPLSTSSEVTQLRDFVRGRDKGPAANDPIPDMRAISNYVQVQLGNGHTSSIFALIDLLRIAAVDPRISGYLVEDSSETVWKVIQAVCDWEDDATNATRLVTVQLASNLFSSPIMSHHLDKGAQALVRLGTWLLLDENSSSKIHECAATLMLNIAKAVHSQRLDGSSASLAESYQVELAVCLLESIQQSKEPEVLRRAVLALGLLSFLAPQHEELKDILTGMDAPNVLRSGSKLHQTLDKTLLDEAIQVV